MRKANMDWEKIDKIKREKENRFNPTERMPASVKTIISKVDARIRRKDVLTEADFHQMDSPIKTQESGHIEATLAKVLRWQSLCGANS